MFIDSLSTASKMVTVTGLHSFYPFCLSPFLGSVIEILSVYQAMIKFLLRNGKLFESL